MLVTAPLVRIDNCKVVTGQLPRANSFASLVPIYLLTIESNWRDFGLDPVLSTLTTL
jgi:hypothetical protein